MSKIVKVKTKGKCETDKDALRLIKRLGVNSTDEKVIEGFSWNCCPYVPGMGIVEMFRCFGIKSGVRLSHYVLFFEPSEIENIRTAEEVAADVCKFVSKDRQMMFFIHANKVKVHVHFLVNNFRFDTGEPCEDTTEEFDKMVDVFNKVLKRHGISRFQYLSANKKSDNRIASEVTVIEVR